MRLEVLALFVVLFAGGCLPPEQDSPSFGSMTRPPGESVGEEVIDVDPSELPAGSDPAAGDDDDDGVGISDWDPAPPVVPDGALVVFDLQCGLLDGTARKTWVKSGGGWEEARTEGVEGGPFPDLEVCFGDGGKTLRWDEGGAIFIEAGGLGHDAEPTETNGRWLGEVSPLADSTSACDAALDARGLAWPVDFGLQLVDLVLPE